MSKENLEPAHSLFYAPKSLAVQLPFPPTDAIATTSDYVKNPPNDGQSIAIKQSFDQRVALLWGPPGTGKTDTVAVAVCAWLEAAHATGVPLSICLGAANYAALDNILTGILELLERRQAAGEALPVDIYRVRSSSGDECSISGVADIERSAKNEACKDLIQRLESGAGLKVVAGMYLQMQKLSRMANVEEGQKSGKVGSPWFDFLVLDEASQMPTSSAVCYACLLKPHGHMLVAGDDKQLGPVYPYAVEETHEGLLDCVYAYFRKQHDIEPAVLSDNYRTNDEIAAWPSVRFYESKYRAVNDKRLLAIGTDTGQPANWPSNLAHSPTWGRLLAPSEPISIVVHRENMSTVSNTFEAHAVASLARQYWFQLSQVEPGLTTQEFWSKRLGLVTPHRAQIATIRNLLGNLAPPDDELAAIMVDTVDRFQGQERDLIVASYTVSDRDFIAGEEDFILNARRFNVTLTRAKSKFVLLLSRNLLSHLPAERETAAAAAHLQLFVEQYCQKGVPLALPAGVTGRPALVCDHYVKGRQ